MIIDPELLKILACPKCKKKIILHTDGYKLLCRNCCLLYEIKNNIPIMLIEETISLSN